ncbi:uncharacterized protein LOC121388209 [Gigantopelta aegis]|uniref:uncharacterized protein LOC121388209 n=1 Tax=Gigantopelta aegis TaxID=1735272 RepID=UPI001B88E148|nr:uncharacterized protein LOC121388209 [Gigantopelta aegis]
MADTHHLDNSHVVSMDEHSADACSPAAWSKGSFLTSSQQEEMAAAVLPVYDPAHFVRRESQQCGVSCDQPRVSRTGGVCRPTSRHLFTVFTLLGVLLLTLGTLAYLHS